MLVYATGAIRDWVDMLVEKSGSERFQSGCFGLAMPFRMCTRMFQNVSGSGSLGARSCSESLRTSKIRCCFFRASQMYLEGFSVSGKIGQGDLDVADDNLRTASNGIC
jgi:hypothetical protein